MVTRSKILYTYHFYIIIIKTELKKNNRISYFRNICYVGKTKHTIRGRWYDHTYDSAKRPEKCSSSRLFNTYGIDNLEILWLKTLTCTKKEARAEEKKYINKFIHSVNKQSKKTPINN